MAEEVERWTADAYRYPPYQYKAQNCLINACQELRFPFIQEKESMLGFPVDYTAPCFKKGDRGTTAHFDHRRTLVGNSGSVPVVACLINQLGWYWTGKFRVNRPY